jgi:hypothetical protein
MFGTAGGVMDNECTEHIKHEAFQVIKEASLHGYRGAIKGA